MRGEKRRWRVCKTMARATISSAIASSKDKAMGWASVLPASWEAFTSSKKNPVAATASGAAGGGAAGGGAAASETAAGGAGRL